MGRNVQSTQRKDGHQRDLLSLGQLQRSEDRHGIDQDQDVGEDVDGRVREPEGFLIEAESRDGGIGLVSAHDHLCLEDCGRETRVVCAHAMVYFYKSQVSTVLEKSGMRGYTYHRQKPQRTSMRMPENRCQSLI